MFDELQKEPEDVFAQTDATAPQMNPPTMSVQSESSLAPMATPQPPSMKSMEMGSEMGEKRAFPWKLIVLFVAIVAVVGLAFFLSMRILNSRTPVTPPAPVVTSESLETSEIETPTPTPAPLEEAVQVPAEDQTADTDKDGLPDAREALLGTDPNSPDTDADGLFDKEEVDVYQTNPLNPDTDGDTYKDGDEVKKGYNPSGPGQLLQIPKK
jgi:hypothetical protein